MAMPRGQQKVHPALPEIDTPQKEEEKMLQIGHNLYDLNFKYSLTLDGISNVTTTDFILVNKIVYLDFMHILYLTLLSCTDCIPIKLDYRLTASS